MERIVKKEHVSKFGKLVAGEKGFKKSMYGHVLYVDTLAGIVFVDNDGISYRFASSSIDSFEEMEFEDKSR